jgi:hypothetical protein
MDYIRTQWGGVEEQAREQVAGNPNAVNWHDKAMKIAETAMVEYWESAYSKTCSNKPETLQMAPGLTHG